MSEQIINFILDELIGKKTREIKLINFTKKNFDQIPFFAISKMTKNEFLNWEKMFQTSKNAISRKKNLPGLF